MVRYTLIQYHSPHGLCYPKGEYRTHVNKNALPRGQAIASLFLGEPSHSRTSSSPGKDTTVHNSHYAMAPRTIPYSDGCYPISHADSLAFLAPKTAHILAAIHKRQVHSKHKTNSALQIT